MLKLKKFNYKEIDKKEREINEEYNKLPYDKKDVKAMVISAMLTFIPISLAILLIASFVTMLIFGVFK